MWGEVVRASVCMECAEAAVIEAKLVHPLFLGFWYCLHLDSQELTRGEEGLIGELGLVLLPYPVSSLMVPYSMLENHDLQHILGFGVGKLALGDEVADVLRQCVYSLAGLLPNIRDKFVPMGPKMLLVLMVVTIASRVALGFFISSGIMVQLSVRVWRACLSSCSNMSLSCIQPLQLSSA